MGSRSSDKFCAWVLFVYLHNHSLCVGRQNTTRAKRFDSSQVTVLNYFCFSINLRCVQVYLQKQETVGYLLVFIVVVRLFVSATSWQWWVARLFCLCLARVFEFV